MNLRRYRREEWLALARRLRIGFVLPEGATLTPPSTVTVTPPSTSEARGGNQGTDRRSG